MMHGWKTWVAAIGMIATGVSVLISGVLAEGVDAEKVKEGIMIIFAGLAMVGIGHKIEKNKE